MVFDYTLTEKQNCQVLHLSGDLVDKNQAFSMVNDIDALLEAGKTKFIADLGDLKYINSSGLNVLIQLLTKTRTRGGETVVCSVSKKVNELLLITKLNTLFKMVEGEEAAIQLLNGKA